MPYDKERDEYYWGKCFSRDEVGYDASYPSPKLSDAYRVLSRHYPVGTLFQFSACGKMYKGKSKLSGASATIDMGTLETHATGIGLTGKAITHGGGGYSTEQKIQAMLGLEETPEHITGIFFRALT